MDQLTLDVRLPDRAEFGNFIHGGNAEVLAAIRRHAVTRREPVVWLRGPEAVGKTHLLLAACRLVVDNGGRAAFLAGSRTPRLSAEDIAGWSGCDLVAIDDIDALAAARDWELALFALFNALREAGGALLVAARGGPREVAFELGDLASRLSSGPVYGLRPLDDEERLDALRVRARKRGFELPDETARYLMHRYPRDLSTLFGVLERLDRASLRAQRRVTVPFVKQVLQSAESENLEH